MTDKQIIINRVDVAECEYLGLYKECKLKCGSCCPVDCSDNPNCHYKLYKRKEQESEEINLKNERLVAGKYTMNEEILKFKQAIDEIEKFCKDACDSCKKFTPNRQSDISCRFCQATQILNIINKVKEK